jgi:YfbU domain
MYDWLQKSYYALSLEDKLQLKEQTLVFPGFCPKTEKSHITYTTFLLENLDRFAYVEVVRPPHAPQPMRDVYEEMLKGLPSFGGDVLTGAQLKAVIAYMSALKCAPAVEQQPRLRVNQR